MLAGAVLAILACAVPAPAEARAGCGHPDAFRLDRSLLPSLLRDATGDPEAGIASPRSPARPRPQGPCRGAWCGGGPDIPEAPAGTFHIRAERWICDTATTRLDTSPPPRRVEGAAEPRPSRRVEPIFRPPRSHVGA